jgi:hypothetical protein
MGDLPLFKPGRQPLSPKSKKRKKKLSRAKNLPEISAMETKKRRH